MRLTFFTSANRPYEPFVLPYIASVLLHNDDARVEICLERPRGFEIENADAIDLLRKSFNDRFLLRGGDFENFIPNSVRFLESPYVMTEFTYIGDIDILILESVLAPHLNMMEKTGLPYSNIIRPGTKRLTGLHFTRSEAYYPVVLPPEAEVLRGGDEALLYRIIEERGLPLPDTEETFRPIHGFHFSLQRQPKPGWGLHKSWLEPYKIMRQNDIWKALLPLFDYRYRVLLLALDTALSCLYPESEIKPMPAYAIKKIFHSI